jgi:hypothetical protein
MNVSLDPATQYPINPRAFGFWGLISTAKITFSSSCMKLALLSLKIAYLSMTFLSLYAYI